MKRTFQRGMCCFVVVAVVLVIMGGLLAQEGKPASRKGTRPVVPVFSTALDSPKFIIDYTNDTGEALDIAELLMRSSVVFDDKEYRCTGYKGTGGWQLAPGKTKTFTIGLSSYMPGWEQKGYSRKLKRWRWQPPLESGRHTLLVKFGNNEYGPITFVWDGDVPLLYE